CAREGAAQAGFTYW
nr:immunoglobulin heavy chain junction region [Mus musculus]MBK4187568.1 immunoglobulin heavy chain junction region [Mus musculus]